MFCSSHVQPLGSVSLKNKAASFFYQQRNCNSEHRNDGKPEASPKNKKEKHYFIEKKEEVGKGGYEQKSIRGEQEFKAVVASCWLS